MTLSFQVTGELAFDSAELKEFALREFEREAELGDVLELMWGWDRGRLTVDYDGSAPALFADATVSAIQVVAAIATSGAIKIHIESCEEVESTLVHAGGRVEESFDSEEPDSGPLPDLSDSVLDPYERGQRVREIGLRGEADTAGLIIPFLADDDSEVRAQAVEALGMLRDRAAADPLIERLSLEKSDVVRVALVIALACFPNEECLWATCNAAVSDSSTEVRQAAIEGLGIRRDVRAVQTVRTVFDQDVDEGVRGAAAIALAQLQDSSRFDAIVATVAEASPLLLDSLAKALMVFAESRAAAALEARLHDEGAAEVRRTVEHAIVKLRSGIHAIELK